VVAQNIFFGIIALVMVVAAVRVVTTKNIVHAALYLVIVLAGVAAQFILTGAEFTGVTQILVYIGAVVVLFLFGIMLTRARIGREVDVDNEKRWLAGLVAVILFAVMSFSLVDAFEDAEIDAIGAGAPQLTGEVSDAIFKDYLIPFEAASFLLLAALIGAIVVARRE
jgi:NADH-quinone oxidoreductase subunit J